jgi:predicted aconitase
MRQTQEQDTRMQLTEEEQGWLDGNCGPAVRMATRVLVEMGGILGADRLIPITSAHIDGCLYHGPGGLDFAERLVRGRGQVVVPTTLNIGSIDLKKPDRIRLSAAEHDRATRLMKAYEALGCAPTWTCAPYQAGHRPKAGSDIAWAESNAVVFANSVLGARTNRYGDFIDICSALTGRAPNYGLHLSENRRATILIRTHAISDALKQRDVFYPVLGTWLGRVAGTDIAAIEGLPNTVTEDQLKALGAAAASSGSVALFHTIGVTPEASTTAEAFGDVAPAQIIDLDRDTLCGVRDALSTVKSAKLDAVALGSPHFSQSEMDQFRHLLGNRRASVPVYVCTGRHVGDRLASDGALGTLAEQGIEVVIDTCVVATPILKGKGGVLMTNSGKFAHYTPPNTGYETIYGSLEDCVESAVRGHVVRDESIWQ